MENKMDIEDGIAKEFKNFTETTFKGISKDELISCMEVVRDVIRESFIFASKTNDDDEQWRERVKIEVGCVDKMINKLDKEKDSRLVEFLRHQNTAFNLSSCRMLALDYARAKKTPLNK